MSTQTPNTMTDEIRKKIAEVKNAKNFENIDQVDDAGKALKELVYLLDELPGPVPSPSDLVVEVDGEKYEAGCFDELGHTHDGEFCIRVKAHPGAIRKEFIYRFDECHIRLLTPQGEVVMDNKME